MQDEREERKIEGFYMIFLGLTFRLPTPAACAIYYLAIPHVRHLLPLSSSFLLLLFLLSQCFFPPFFLHSTSLLSFSPFLPFSASTCHLIVWPFFHSIHTLTHKKKKEKKEKRF